MKKFKLIFATVVTLLCLCFLFSCNQNEELTLENVYSMAKNQGYEGSIDDFVAAFRGDDGLGISSATVDENNHLIITLSNGNELDCGEIKVENGINGKDGVDGKDGVNGQNGKDGSVVTIGENGNWYIDNVDTGKTAVGKNGQNGNNGKDGANWYCNAGVPASSLGKNGDLYLNTENYDVYRKSSLGWDKVGNFFSGSGADFTVNAGDNYNISLDGDTNKNALAAAKGMFSSVLIECYEVNSYGSYYASAGSGIIYWLDKINGDAYIITNYHVVYSAYSSNNVVPYIYAYLFGMEDDEINCQYVGGSMEHDIAVLKVEDSSVLRQSSASAVTLGAADTVSVLDNVIVIGNAEGLGMSATLGAVSVDVESAGIMSPDSMSVINLDVFRIDAAVNHGNSGGGLFNLNGELIGIVSAKLEDERIENIAYAIPVDLAVSIADNIIENHSVNPQKLELGVYIEVTPDGATFDSVSGKITRKDRIEVSSISGEPSNCVFNTGDVIKSVTVNGTVYEINRAYELDVLLFSIREQDSVSFTVLRSGVDVDVTINSKIFIDIS